MRYIIMLVTAVVITIFGLACKPTEKIDKKLSQQDSFNSKSTSKATENTSNHSTAWHQKEEEIIDTIVSKLSSLGVEFNKHSKSIGSKANEELSYQLRVEYKVFELDFGKEVSSIEDKLNKYGKERWNCFHVEKVRETKHAIFCKRIPLTAARILPGLTRIF